MSGILGLGNVKNLCQGYNSQSEFKMGLGTGMPNERLGENSVHKMAEVSVPWSFPYKLATI